MAIEGKKINQLDAMSTVTNETVFPAVYVNNGTANSTANKVTLEQVKNYVEQDVYTKTQTNTLLNGKQDTLPAGTTGYFLKKTADGVEWAQAASGTTDVNTISATSGTIALETNKVYKVTLSGNTTFTLPTTVDNTKFNQIYVQIDVTDDITVDFGTTNYFTVEPVLNEGPAWINYEYNANENAWYVGQIGVVASSGANTDLSNLTDLGKSQVANLAMPSDVTTSLTVGSSGDTYTAPSDGYFLFRTNNNASSNNYTYLYNLTANLCSYAMAGSNIVAAGFVLARAGDIVRLEYYNSTIDTFTFTFAQGTKQEAN